MSQAAKSVPDVISPPLFNSWEGESSTPPNIPLPETTIEPRSGWSLPDLREIWRYRELVYFLIWRDIKVRYKQTFLGALWAILQPLATMGVFCLFLGRLTQQTAGGWPYPLFVFAGILPWTYFANALNAGCQSVVSNQNLVTKVYFPRLIIPLTAVAAGLVDFAIASILLFGMILFWGVPLSWTLLILPWMTLAMFLAALGLGTLLSALTVTYRDFRHLIPFVMQLWMLATPAIYLQTDAIADPNWQALLALNPAQGLIVNFRAAALGSGFDGLSLAISGTMVLAFLVLGFGYFRKMERSFADII